MGSLPKQFTVIVLSSREDLKSYLLTQTNIKETTVNYLFEQKVTGKKFIQLTNDSLISNYSSINFGQRKECLKLIENILASEDKFIFTTEDEQQNNPDNEVFDAAVVKLMSPTDLSLFLQDKFPGVHPETIIFLLDEDVDGESFLEFTNDSLQSNFPGLSSDQRESILKVVAKAGDEHVISAFTFPKHNTIEIPILQDMECSIIQGFIDDGGVLKPVTEETSDKVDVAPGFSGSFLKKRKRKSDPKPKSKFNPHDVEPLDVLSILNASHEGIKVIASIRIKRRCEISDQKVMMRKIYEHYSADKESPTKYYPGSDVKVAIAKGIVTAFPDLGDATGTPWLSWLEVVHTKFETVQSKLQPHQKKNKVTAKSNSVTVVRSRTKTSTSAQSYSSASYHTNQSAQEECDINNQVELMGQMLPNNANKQMISLALSQTFRHRRDWICAETPSATETILRYKHLKSFNGEMISEEFRRIHQLHDDAVEKLKRAVPFILKYSETVKPQLFEEVSNKFSNDNLKVLVLLSKILTVILNNNTSLPEEREHVKNFKSSIESLPSSALFQVVPDGTDVESHVSVETHPVISEQLTPIFPFLLWCTRDFNSGMIYLKIDKQCLFLGCFENEDSILRAFDIFVKAHHVFMLKYHPYLRNTVFDYFEALYGIKSPVNSVARFITALKNVAI